jgi:hypothetical protein
MGLKGLSIDLDDITNNTPITSHVFRKSARVGDESPTYNNTPPRLKFHLCPKCNPNILSFVSQLCLATCVPGISPYQFSLDSFEECFHCRVIIAITFA